LTQTGKWRRRGTRARSRSSADAEEISR